MTNKVAQPDKRTSQNPQKETRRQDQTKARNGNKVEQKEKGTFPTRWAFAT